MWLDLIRPNVHADTETFMNSFKSTIIKYEGRPHFGKENILAHDSLMKCFPRLADFIKVRNELDPDKLFANPYYESLLGTDSNRPMICRFKSLRTGSMSMMKSLRNTVEYLEEDPPGV